MTNPSRWQRINELFHASLDLDPPARRAYLLDAAPNDPDLLREVESLLASHARNDLFLEQPTWAVASDLVTDSCPSLVGRQIGAYQILQELGRGGMGVVYAAEDTRLRRPVALKAATSELTRDPVRRERLTREARAAAALSHPAIATVFALEEIDHELYIVSELVKGQTLREELKNGPLPTGRLISTLLDIAAGLVAAHAGGVVHRDLKPDNVIRRTDGQIKILDFGLARMTDPPGQGATRTRLTRTGLALGTPGYMPPEQLSGLEVDARADVFAFGVLAWELATGEHPFGSPHGSRLEHVTQDGERRQEIRSLPLAGLDRIAKRCMRGMPVERYQSSADLLADLRALADRLREPAAPRYGARRWPSLGTRVSAALLLAAVFLLNWIETTAETHLAATSGAGTVLRQELAGAMQWLEGSLSFERHDLTGAVAIYGYSAAYFFLMPLLVAVTLAGFAMRDDSRPFRVLCLALVFDYAVSLPFYLFFPVPERWAFPPSGAILLSDLWSARLIEMVRPLSALDNCFPSFHVSATVLVIAAAFLFDARFRTLTVPLGLMVSASAFVLGIHWLADIAAGAAAGMLSIWLAIRFDAFMSHPVRQHA